MKYPSKVKQNSDERQLIRWAPTVSTQEQHTWNSLLLLWVNWGAIGFLYLSPPCLLGYRAPRNMVVWLMVYLPL